MHVLFFQVDFEEAKNYAEQMDAIFAETSALQATNVHALFEAISKCQKTDSSVFVLCRVLFNGILPTATCILLLTTL